MGFRCLTIAGTRDPIMIAGIDKIIDEVKTSVSRNLSLDDDSIRINFHLYGKNGVMEEAMNRCKLPAMSWGLSLM